MSSKKQTNNTNRSSFWEVTITNETDKNIIDTFRNDKGTRPIFIKNIDASKDSPNKFLIHSSSVRSSQLSKIFQNSEIKKHDAFTSKYEIKKPQDYITKDESLALLRMKQKLQRYEQEIQNLKGDIKSLKWENRRLENELKEEQKYNAEKRLVDPKNLPPDRHLILGKNATAKEKEEHDDLLLDVLNSW